MDASNVSRASATGNPRNKTALKPGRSLMDWIRLTNSGKDLTGCGGKLRDISPEELALHNKRNDAWMAIRGKVYNMTSYFEFHPGGEDELDRGMGIDATDLFDEVHRWVNFESMLSKCLVGRLKTSNLPTKKQFTAPRVLSFKQSKNEAIGVTSDWMQNSTSITFIFYTRQKDLDPSTISVSCDGSRLKVRIYQCRGTNSHYSYGMQLEKKVVPKGSVKVSALTGKVELMFQKVEESHWKSAGTPLQLNESDQLFRRAILSQRTEVTHNVRLFTFTFGAGDIFHVPVGWHVPIKLVLEDGTELVKSFTPVLSGLLPGTTECPDTDTNGPRLHFLIKIYSGGLFTSHLDHLPEGTCIEIGDPTGSFNSSAIQDQNVVALAAGTGITPIIRLIVDCLASSQDRKVWLFFFNRKAEDIVWHADWDVLVQKYPDRLKIWHILSDPEADWTGLTGRISESILDEIIKPVLNSPNFVSVCGPTEFTTTALRLVEKTGYSSKLIHAFLG